MATAFLDKLKEIFPEYKVEDYPDDPSNYNLGSAKGAILLTLADRRFQRGQATDGTGQMNDPVWQVTYVTRSLRSKKKNPGAYEMLDRGKALAALEFVCGNAVPVREFFIDVKSGGVWYWGQTWSNPDYFVAKEVYEYD